MQNPKNTLHYAVKEEKRCKLARGKSWLGQAEQPIQHVCDLTQLKQVRDWEKHPTEFKPYYKNLLSENLGMHCREWPARKANAEVQMLAKANSKAHDIAIYTDDSVTRDRSGWGFTVKQGGRTVHEDSGAHRVATSSLTMEAEAVTHAIQWQASQRDAQITHAIILTDSMNLLQKVESGMGCLDRHTVNTVFGCKDFYGSTALSTLESIRMNGQESSRYHIWSAAWQGRGAQRLEELSEHGLTTLIGRRKEEWRKDAAFHPPRSGTICFQSDKRWYCFEGNLGETAERWGGARMGLS